MPAHTGLLHRLLGSRRRPRTEEAGYELHYDSQPLPCAGSTRASADDADDADPTPRRTPSTETELVQPVPDATT